VRSALIDAVRPAGGSGEESIVDVCSATDESTAGAMEAFLRFLNRLKLPQIIEFELRTVFYEVVTNIRMHSGISHEDPIAFSVVASPALITLRFADSGAPFDPTEHRNDDTLRTAATDGRTRGFGITMIHKLADSVRYAREGDEINVLEITKGWSR
jgi:anti-sigma regulatory factor (Ser/Thr protein kinase)